jgi:hypothetical protein
LAPLQPVPKASPEEYVIVEVDINAYFDGDGDGDGDVVATLDVDVDGVDDVDGVAPARPLH